MGLFSKKTEDPNTEFSEGPTPKYALAHYALRQMALERPLQFLGVLASPDATDFLNSIIDHVSQVGGRKADFDATALTIHTSRINTYPCAIIEMPEPDDLAEAHMVATILLLNPDTDTIPDQADVPCRYFTLEKGMALESHSARTVLCEWADDTHINHGDGPPVSIDAFKAAIQDNL